jgi:acetylglutamate kinase
MSNIPGILSDLNDSSTLIREIDVDKVDKLKEDGVISGGMIPKVESCVEAVNFGVKKVFIIDGRVPHAILVELMTDEGIGTMFTRKNA